MHQNVKLQEQRINRVFIFLFFIFVILISGCSTQEIEEITGDVVSKSKEIIDGVDLNEMYKNVALELAGSISGVEPIDYSTFENYEKFKLFTIRVNYIFSITNENFGTSFEPVLVEQEEFKDIIRTMQKYSPLIEPFNDMTDKSRKVSEDDSNSIEEFYISVFVFGTDTFLIQTGGIHKYAFRGLGHLNGSLKLYKIKEICGNKCFGLVLKETYGFLRNKAENFTISFAEWLGENYKYLLGS